MREKKIEKIKDEFEEKYAPEEIKNAEEKISNLIGNCSARVFKDYLPYVSKKYSVVDCKGERIPEEIVALFDVSKFVVDSESIVDKLKNVYHILAYTENSIGLILRREMGKCTVSLAVGVGGNDNAKKAAEQLRDALRGNFPGVVCGEPDSYDEGNKAIGGIMNASSVAVVSNIATEFSEDFVTQGIEKLLDGIRPESQDKGYTIIILAKALTDSKLEEKKRELYNIYTMLSPYAKKQEDWSIGQARDWSSNWNVGFNAHIHMPLPKASPLPKRSSAGGGLNAGFGHSWGGSVSGNKGGSIEINDYCVSHTLETIEKQMKRLEECAALGLWETATYVFSNSYAITNEVAHMYMSLTQGMESFYEKPSINIWSDKKESDRNDIKAIIDNILRMQHPQFIKKIDEEVGAHWGQKVSATTTVSGAELARAMNLPAHSVPGFTVVKCAAFGREISFYDTEKNQRDIELGNIHHMHETEKNTKVKLSKKSLASHVFVTGSTGAGKSNTVYQILSEAERKNVTFLVVEPAKGEYKYAFTKKVKVLGSNPKRGELLKLNPFVFPSDIHISEHIDRILEIFNVCWPMYAAMPAVLKDAVIRAYESCGWDITRSENSKAYIYPTFEDVLNQIDEVMSSSDYSDENKGNYKGALKTRLRSLTNGICGMIFCGGNTLDTVLFESNVIVDLSRIGANETKALIMGMLIIKLQEFRMSRGGINSDLRHLTVLEEAHNILKNSNVTAPGETGNVAGKSVEMIANAIAEMRTYGEGFVIVDQSPGLMDMSAIRNTNTKIIMRLPDKSDRELVGRAAGLNDEQIDELAKLQEGVAAVYQNEWVEPVLCKVHEYKMRTCSKSADESINTEQKKKYEEEQDEIREFMAKCLYDPDYLMLQQEKNFIDCVDTLEIPGSVKALLVDCYRTPYPEKQEIWAKTIFEFFGGEKIISGILRENDHIEPNMWKSTIMKEILRKFNLYDEDNFERDEFKEYRFIQGLCYAYESYCEHFPENVNMDDCDKITEYMVGLEKEIRENGIWRT